MAPRPEYFSCRVYGVLPRAGRVLLARSVFKDRLFVNFPGGGVELGEAPGAALSREFLEETGLRVRAVRILFASQELHLSTQLPMQIVSVYWLVRRLSGRLRPAGNGDDVVSVFWADPAALPTAEMFPAEREFAARLPDLL